MSLSGKIALVTGAAQGLGKAFSQALLQNGAKAKEGHCAKIHWKRVQKGPISNAIFTLQQVLLSDVNMTQGQETLKEFQNKYGENNVIFMKSDVTSQAQMEETFQMVKDQFGGLDIMCNNAGIGGEGPDIWEKTVDINMKGMIRGTMLALNMMRQDKGGRGGVIVNVASMAGLNPNPFGPVYCATKHAIVGFSRSWALNPDCVKNGVRVNVLCPAFVDTALVSGLTEEGNVIGSATAAMDFVNKIGIMTPETVAEGFMDLVQDESRNGAVLKMGKSFGQCYHEY